jgi:hypothetical protein
MNFLAARNAIGIGLGGIISIFGGRGTEQAVGNLLCENGDNLVQEDGGLLLLE